MKYRDSPVRNRMLEPHVNSRLLGTTHALKPVAICCGASGPSPHSGVLLGNSLLGSLRSLRSPVLFHAQTDCLASRSAHPLAFSTAYGLLSLDFGPARLLRRRDSRTTRRGDLASFAACPAVAKAAFDFANCRRDAGTERPPYRRDLGLERLDASLSA